MISGKYAKVFGLEITTSGCLNFTLDTIMEKQLNNTKSMLIRIKSNNTKLRKEKPVGEKGTWTAQVY